MLIIFFSENPTFLGREMSIYLYKEERYSVTHIWGEWDFQYCIRCVLEFIYSSYPSSSMVSHVGVISGHLHAPKCSGSWWDCTLIDFSLWILTPSPQEQISSYWSPMPIILMFECYMYMLLILTSYCCSPLLIKISFTLSTTWGRTCVWRHCMVAGTLDILNMFQGSLDLH